MRRLLATALFVGACTGAAGSAHAANSLGVPLADRSSIMLVDQGCGPGGFRDYRGFCRPKRYAPPPPPPRYARGCGPRFHPTPYGCRPNY